MCPTSHHVNKRCDDWAEDDLNHNIEHDREKDGLLCYNEALRRWEGWTAMSTCGSAFCSINCGYHKSFDPYHAFIICMKI